MIADGLGRLARASAMRMFTPCELASTLKKALIDARARLFLVILGNCQIECPLAFQVLERKNHDAIGRILHGGATS